MKTVFIYLHLFIVITSNSLLAEKRSTLKFVQILFRHGDRSPITLYPNDPNPESVWEEGFGKLTILGRKQHYALGKHFRSMYKDFITSSPLEVHAVSSGVDRCIKSAATNLASFFAPDPDWSFDTDLKWQPIVVHYIPRETDKYLETDSYCPRAEEEQERVLNSPEGLKFTEDHKVMFEKLALLSGNHDIINYTEATYLHDCLLIEKKYNLSVPEWADEYWKELTNVSNLGFFWAFNSPLLHRLRAGPLLQKMIEKMNKKIAGDSEHLKVAVYSAHDTNIAAVLVALNLFNMRQPPYCSTLIFELHEMEGGANTIRILYLNSTNPEKHVEEAHVLVLDKCSEFCPLEYFVNYTSSIIPDDWEEECQLEKTLVQKIADKKVTIGWFFVLTTVVIVIMSLYTVWRLYARRQDKYAYHLMPLN